jgi:hypothetical protein
MTDNARRIHHVGHPRPGLSVAAGADIRWTYSAPDLYELLVIRRAMLLAGYGQFVADAMPAALLER